MAAHVMNAVQQKQRISIVTLLHPLLCQPLFDLTWYVSAILIINFLGDVFIRTVGTKSALSTPADMISAIRLQLNSSLVQDFGYVYKFVVTDDAGAPSIYYLDLKNGIFFNRLNVRIAECFFHWFVYENFVESQLQKIFILHDVCLVGSIGHRHYSRRWNEYHCWYLFLISTARRLACERVVQPSRDMNIVCETAVTRLCSEWQHFSPNYLHTLFEL